MREELVRALGLVISLAYASVIVWVYARQPETLAQVTGGLAASVGAYHVDQQAFTDALTLFRKDQFPAARAAFVRADPAERDPRTQFYIAYTYYRQGWHRLYRDDELFREGLKIVDNAIALAPGGRVVVDDATLGMHTADELRAELEAGLKREPSDFNPLRVLDTRK